MLSIVLVFRFRIDKEKNKKLSQKEQAEQGRKLLPWSQKVLFDDPNRAII
jgi:hypothetical protein